jgi:hypothetical protein
VNLLGDNFRAKIKSAAEELNGIVSAAPDDTGYVRGNTPSATCSRWTKIGSPRKLDLKVRFSLQMRAERWSADESKELRGWGTCPKTRAPVKEDIGTLEVGTRFYRSWVETRGGWRRRASRMRQSKMPKRRKEQ